METFIIRERERAALKEFYSKMNETSRNLGLTKITNWAVSHGMHHDNNYSSALDVATISWNAMRQHALFCSVVNTKKFECSSRVVPGHQYKWENSNSMLWESSKQYHGIKTGVTQTAGPSLAVNYRTRCNSFDFIVVILNCKSREARFSEIPKLVDWACIKINKVK